MRLFINGVPQDLAPSATHLDVEEVNGTEIDLSSFHKIELSDNEPVFIVSTYALKHEDDKHEEAIAGHFSGIEDHLGISNDSLNMTDRLWTALCSTNYEAYEAVEVCVIGRCVEQIISVAAIPFYVKSVGQQDAEHQREVLETALIHNIVNSQHVDVQTAFFQIRLLVKVYNFIATRYFEPDLLERFQSLDAMRTAYLDKLRDLIRSSLTWLINTDMKPSKLLLALGSQKPPVDMETHPSERLKRCEENRVWMNHDQSYYQACYATLAVWYVVKHCPQAIDNAFKSQTLLPKLLRAFEVVQKRASRDKEPTPKNDVLQWFHLCCFYLLCNERFGPRSDGEAMDGFTASGLDSHEVLKTQQRFEKYVSRLKTSQIENYSIEHEELDRVILLGEELGLNAIPTQFTASLATSRALQTRRRLADRKRTTRFNPGPASWKNSRKTSNCPWELLATNHQSFLRIADDANIKSARERLFEFMMSDYSFMTSWDHADRNMIGTWWDQESCSVICATLIDLRNEGKMKSAMSEAAAEHLNDSIHDLLTTPVETSPTGPAEDPSPNESIRDILLQMKQHQIESSRDQLMQLRQLLAQEDMGANLSIKAFDWLTCKPPRVYHPSWWVQSLTDTPEFYRVKQSKDVPLRKDLRRYLVTRGHSMANTNEHMFFTTYTTENINTKVHAEDVQFLSLFDLSLTDRFTFESKSTSIKNYAQALEHRGNGQITRETATISRTRTRRKQASTVYNLTELEAYRKVLFDRLNDSLVDLGAKHRVLFAEKCTPSLVRSFIYVWHPDALDTFDNYFGSTSVFSEHREAVMWTTNITITHWSIRLTSLSKEHVERFRENRNNGDFPPLSIAQLSSTKKQRKTLDHLRTTDVVEERSSSLVITGDPSGHLWICSVWSSLTDSEAMSASVNTLLPVLGQFIHQQACARCLAFLILLGHLCEKLAAEYDMILSRLDVIVGLGERVLLEGLEWGTTEAVDKLKKMLWGLEALRVFDDRLSASLAQIQKAREAMERTIKQEAGQQHVDLLEAYNNVIEEFEKRYGMLSDVQIRTQLKIRQVTGLRDGISTVTNVEDSQTALRDSQTTIRQGNNIRILTYITIAYLPLGFVTALFSIQYATFMNHATNVTFAVLVIIFVIGTYTLALSLESIMVALGKIGDKRRDRATTTPSKPTQNELHREPEDADPGSGYFSNFLGLRRRRRNVGEEEEIAEKISMAA